MNLPTRPPATPVSPMLPDHLQLVNKPVCRVRLILACGDMFEAPRLCFETAVSFGNGRLHNDYVQLERNGEYLDVSDSSSLTTQHFLLLIAANSERGSLTAVVRDGNKHRTLVFGPRQLPVFDV